MKKYVLISLIVHLAILFLFATIKTDEVEKEKLVKNEELYKYANETIEKLWKLVVEIFETSYKEK